MFRRLPVPMGGILMGLLDALPLFKAKREVELGPGIALFRRLPVPAYGLHLGLLEALTVYIAIS